MSMDGHSGAERRRRLHSARLYLVCPAIPPAGSLSGRALDRLLHAAVAGGVDVIQLRDKDVDEEELLAHVRPARELCLELGVLLVINDRPELARLIGADGVHVGQDDMPVAEVRAIVGPDVLIGLSTHAPGEIDVAEPVLPDGSPAVDYIGVGPVHETPTKPGRAAVGQELVRYAALHARVPFFAIGGLNADNLSETVRAGASRVCVLRAISQAEDPRLAAAALRRLL